MSTPRECRVWQPGHKAHKNVFVPWKQGITTLGNQSSQSLISMVEDSGRIVTTSCVNVILSKSQVTSLPDTQTNDFSILTPEDLGEEDYILLSDFLDLLKEHGLFTMHARTVMFVAGEYVDEQPSGELLFAGMHPIDGKLLCISSTTEGIRWLNCVSMSTATKIAPKARFIVKM